MARLPELVRAQQAAEGVLNSFAKCPDAFEEDLLSPAAICQYYQNYYSYPEMQVLMNYPAEDPETGVPVYLFDLLACNQVGSMAAEARGTDSQLPRIMRQAFHTAGGLFHVIEENTTDVLVPYKDGILIAEQLETVCGDPEMRMRLLRQAQAYSVSLYEHEIALLLKQHALRELPDGILVLEKGYYEDQLGFTAQRKPLEPLIT